MTRFRISVIVAITCLVAGCTPPSTQRAIATAETERDEMALRLTKTESELKNVSLEHRRLLVANRARHRQAIAESVAAFQAVADGGGRLFGRGISLYIDLSSDVSQDFLAIHGIN